MSANEQLQAIMTVFNQPHYADRNFTVGDIAAYGREQRRRTVYEGDHPQRSPATTAEDRDYPDDQATDNSMPANPIETLGAG